MTISDNTVLHLSEPFTKTWRIRNSGTCTWTTGYKLTFAGGEQLGASNSEALPINVAPGQTLDISVRMVAPSSAGRYEGTWQLQSAEGKTFGFGASGKDHVWVKIRAAAPAYATSTPTPPAATATASARASASPTSTVVMTETAAPATPQVMVDFAGTACAAQWQSNTGVLSCPGKEDDPNGFVLSLSEARLEDGSTASLPTLLTFPSSSPDGYILGVYPEYPVQNGDHFQASVGCEQGATSCSVLFRLSYLDEAGAPHDLWTLGEFYDGKYFNLDLDLSGLAGHKVKLVLDIMPLGSATGDRALWVAPRIVRFPVTEATATSTPTMAPSTSTPTPGKTATAPAAATATAVSAPSPTPAAPGQPSPIQQVLDAIATFFQQLFGGK